jgi:hypothetical protein
MQDRAGLSPWTIAQILLAIAWLIVAVLQMLRAGES